jgi:hypothetical protein
MLDFVLMDNILVAGLLHSIHSNLVVFPFSLQKGMPNFDCQNGGQLFGPIGIVPPELVIHYGLFYHIGRFGPFALRVHGGIHKQCHFQCNEQTR